jgi:manganese/zinc/iron transport system permease protein
MLPPFTREVVETIGVMMAVAAACALPGVFLVLRRLVLVGDAISHVLLLGIVLAYFVVRDPASVWLIVGATAAGVLTVALIEWLQRTRRVKEDAAIGLVFPAFFSLGTLLASMYLRNTHLDVDRVLLGAPEFASWDRLVLVGTDCGPRAIGVLMLCFLVALLFVSTLYKELVVATFDVTLAAAFGFAPAALHYGLMTLVSLTTVAAFDAVGPVLVLAFFTLPAITIRLLTHHLHWLLIGSMLYAIVMACVGTIIALRFDLNIAGTSAGCLGVLFLVVHGLKIGMSRLIQPRQYD